MSMRTWITLAQRMISKNSGKHKPNAGENNENGSKVRIILIAFEYKCEQFESMRSDVLFQEFFYNI